MSVPVQHSDEQHRGIVPEERLASGTPGAGKVPTGTGTGEAAWTTPTAAAPTTADYLVGTAQGGLSAEIVVGTTPNGELGGTWAAITVDATHSGSTHAATQAAAEATAAAALATHAGAADPHTGYVLESLIDAAGDLIVGTADNTVGRLAKGADSTVLTISASTHVPVWAAPSGGGSVATDTIWDAAGDLAVGSGADTAARLAKGSDGQVLTVDPTTHLLVWATPGTGAVATDVIWDAAGDLAVGSGSNTAARLAIGGVGGHLSRINGVVAWDSGTSNPASAVAGDRFYRSDLRLPIVYDGTRWLTLKPFRDAMQVGDTVQGHTVTGVIRRGGTQNTNNFDLWIVAFEGWTAVLTTNSGTSFWTITFNKQDAALAGTSLGSFNTSADAATTIIPHNTTVGAAVVTATYPGIYVNAAKTVTPGALYSSWTMVYHLIVT